LLYYVLRQQRRWPESGSNYSKRARPLPSKEKQSKATETAASYSYSARWHRDTGGVVTIDGVVDSRGNRRLVLVRYSAKI